MNERPLRTLLISPFFAADPPGDEACFSAEIAQEWLRRGRAVAVICARAGGLGELPPTGMKQGELTLHPLAAAQDWQFALQPDAGLRRTTAELIRAFRPDVIHVHHVQGVLPAIQAGLESRVPSLLTAMDYGMICFNARLDAGRTAACDGPESPARCAACLRQVTSGPTRRFGAWLPRGVKRHLWPLPAWWPRPVDPQELHAAMRHVLRSLDAVIVPSPFLGEKLLHFGAAEEQVTTVPLGLPRTVMLRPVKLPAEALRLAYFGGTDPLKGLGTIVEAVGLLPEGLPMEISAFGGDDLRDRLIALSPRVRRYLRYRPLPTGTALAAEHAAIDAVLMPSVTPENSPRPAMVSLANGSPVIAADVPGLSRLILPERNGLLVRAGDPRAWAAAFIRAVQRPAVIRRMQADTRFDRTTADFVDDLEQIENALVRPPAMHPPPGRGTTGPRAGAFL